MQIFLFSLGSDAYGIENTGILCPEEAARADRYRAEQDRLRFINGRIWMRAIFARELGCPAADLVVREQEGSAPEISHKGAPLPFRWSLSRSGGLGAMALSSENNVGLDIEIDKDVPEETSIAETNFSLKEQELLKRTAGHLRAGQFLRLWTAKEALTKAVGTGLSEDWTRFSVDPESARIVEGETPFLPDKWHLEWLDQAEGWIGCVAADAPIKNLQLQDLRA